MTFEALGNLGDFISAIVVLITLVYIAVSADLFLSIELL